TGSGFAEQLLSGAVEDHEAFLVAHTQHVQRVVRLTLGQGERVVLALFRREIEAVHVAGCCVSPFQGSSDSNIYPGQCPGLSCFAPLGRRTDRERVDFIHSQWFKCACCQVQLKNFFAFSKNPWLSGLTVSSQSEANSCSLAFCS